MKLFTRLFVIALILLTGSFHRSFSQGYTPIIEPVKMVKYAPGLIVKQGYLVVPENRHQPNGRKTKIPFVFVRQPRQDAQKNISLYCTGGPGYSATANMDSVIYNSGLVKFGGFIVFGQRGTKKAVPCLTCTEVDSAVKRSYKQYLNKDSLVLIAVKECRNRFTGQGIDLSAYNTIESAEDINDLRLALHVDSLNLVGISYSGSLMLTLARNHPEAVRSLILNSPLPGYVNYEEHSLYNINEALDQVFANCEADSAGNKAYDNLKSRFRQYFTAITDKKFSISYLEKGARDSVKMGYTKNELLDAIVNRLNSDQVKTVPAVINDIISGKHDRYIRDGIDGSFSGDKDIALGMRYSVYCSEQIAYSNLAIQQQQDKLMPWFSGYPCNSPDKAICDCWKVNPEPAVVKTAVYSNVPALIVAGDIDPWCRPFYNRLIKRTMPNSQLLIRHNKGHAPGFTVDGIDYVKLFLANPFQKLVSQSKDLVIE